MIDVFLMCLVMSSLDCTTLHPDLSNLIPHDLLPPDNLLHPNPVELNTNFSVIYNI